MKCTIPEISWHNQDPILSVDIQHASDINGTYRLATGGTDHHVVIWQLNILPNGGVAVEMLSDLIRHNRAVNAVRFSPNGQILASSDDEGAIILWKKSEESNDLFMEETEKENKEHWSILKMLRGHIEDVYDLCWSKCSQFLASGSVDNSAILWDISKGKSMYIIKDHKGWVQGVALDPKGQLLATLSSDRYMRVFNLNTKKLIHKVFKTSLPSSGEDQVKSTRLFYDDTLKSFCRRLSFSPDGKFLVAPSGVLEEGEGKPGNATHVFIRSCLSRPVLCLPTQDKYTIAVRFCPLLFNLRETKGKDNKETSSAFTNLFALPYRMIFAVATQNAVLMYDTQQPIPFAKVSKIHYTRLSDVSWSSDGRLLIVSSTDGYCSLVSFTEGELGTVYLPPEETLKTAQENAVISPASKMEGRQSNEGCQTPSANQKMAKSGQSTPVTPSANQKVVKSAQNTPVTPKPEVTPTVTPKQKETIRTPTATPIAMPIAVKRKPGKRVELITLSSTVENKAGSSHSTFKEQKETDTEAKSQEKTAPKNVSEAHSPKSKSVTAAETSGNATGVKNPPSAPSPKTPRRVPLITIL